MTFCTLLITSLRFNAHAASLGTCHDDVALHKNEEQGNFNNVKRYSTLIVMCVSNGFGSISQGPM